MKSIQPWVFFPSAGLILIFVTLTLIFQESVGTLFENIQATISKDFGWLYVIAVNVVLVFCIYLGFGRYKNIRLGGPDSKPEFSTWAWLSMLFNAGIGLVLMFYAVAEPISHFSNPPYGEAGTLAAANNALNLSYLHWGLHGWGVYALMGLAIAFFTYNRGLPLGVRWILYPLLGDKLKGPIGHLIDTMAVVATMFGLATTLGLGIQHINSGMNYLFGVPDSPQVQVILIGIITICATISVVSGLHNGIQLLSKIASIMAIILMAFMLIVGPTLFIIGSTVQSTGFYLQSLIGTSTWMEIYRGTHWMDSWTFFYWAWWFAWAPFVGLFIARISKGRTIREFILGVLLGPTAASIIWISIFGSTAFHIELFGPGGISEAVQENINTGLYSLLQMFPLPYLSILFVVIAGVIFFVTSSDSGSLVIDFITSGGKDDTPVKLRIFWALIEGAVAAVLVLGGGLVALQTGSLVTGLPVCVLMLLVCYAVNKALKKYQEEQKESRE
ncbi:BCCT family transporter [Algoriphagus halophytocola]|uniref:BCCT family transporter n=1 Tax=Algoriphagus halophytocola TaxID=2991499 RepID=A0ABY6MCR9_9BACT|nr:BCCT family transporter [Algoriphagus sp. TR-M5]UZD21515.1 BCCT family transporter [Algoriphagus sp. TR-M5]